MHRRHDGANHPVVGASARDMLDRPANEAGSVLSTTKSYLDLFRDPTIAKNTSRSDFRINELMNYVDPISLYIVTKPNDKARLKPLVRIVVNMIVRRYGGLLRRFPSHLRPAASLFPGSHFRRTRQDSAAKAERFNFWSAGARGQNSLGPPSSK